MRKKSHDRILREEPKEQHLSTVPKSYSSLLINDLILAGKSSW